MNPAEQRAARVKARQETRRLEAYRAVLNTPAGRTVFHDLLGRFGLYRSIWHPSALIHYNAGKQDAAHELLSDLIRANEEQVEVMNREARERRKIEESELTAQEREA